MAFEDEFLELMPLSCIVNPSLGVNGYGEANGWGDDQSIRCHVQYRAKQITGEVGLNESNTRLEEGIVYLAGSYPIDTTWRLRIPVPGGTREVKIMSVEQNTDEGGFHHTALHFGAQ